MRIRVFSVPLFALLGLAATCAAEDIYVNGSVGQSGSGSSSSPKKTIAEAITIANRSPGLTTIRIAAGNYAISATLAIDTPVSLRGDTVLEYDSAGIPTGNTQNATRLLGTAGLGTNPIVSVGKSGAVLDSLEIRGLVFEGQADIGGLVEIRRVRDTTVRDSKFTGMSNTPGIATFASSGTIRNNYFGGLVAGAILSAGYAGSPAEIMFRDNRAKGNNNGVFLTGTSDGIPEPGNQLVATVRNNDLRENAVSGMRITVKGSELVPGGTAGLFEGRVSALIRDNNIASNGRAVVVDAGFPNRVVPGTTTCDTRPFTGLLDLTFRDNNLTGNTTIPLIAFTRLQALTNANQRNLYKYLVNATYSISDRDDIFHGVIPTDPDFDSYSGPNCHFETVPLNNTVTVFGQH